jgi:nucleotide-binding universal stress UspA family protein
MRRLGVVAVLLVGWVPAAAPVAAPAGTVDVVHAGVQASDVPLAAPAATATAQKSADATEEALRRKVEDLKRDGATVESASTEITTGGPAYPITEFARDTGADLIVVGTSGSSQLVRLLVGSVTRRLLELAPARGGTRSRACPVDHGTGSRSQILIEARSIVPRNV